MATPQPLFTMEGVSKFYGGVRALEKASLVVASGRVQAVLGENGAGKSTLIKIMSGVVAPDEGAMTLAGAPVAFASPAEAQKAGIACIFQELSLIPDLSVADNVLLTGPPTRFGLIDRRAQRDRAEAALARAGASDIHPRALVKDLPLSRRQLVEIAKALARAPKILILDEATSALGAADVGRVLALLSKLRGEGLALLYISHRMHEIAEIADDCTVFRNGRNVASFKTGEKRDEEIVELMIGRDYKKVFPPKPAARTAQTTPALSVKGLTWTNRLKQISFSVDAGEIVGLGGLDGQGQRELLLALFGVLRGVTGEVRVDGVVAAPGSPRESKAPPLRIALVPEDRKTEGLMLPMGVGENLTFAALESFSHFGVIDRAAERAIIADAVASLAIKVSRAEAPVASLSGGNQQKVVIGKWLATKPRVILLNDPTRGIDVGTKQEIYALLRRLADAGAAILFYSTDYDELIGCCDRALVLYDGAVTRTLCGAEITERALVASALNLEFAAGGGT